MDSKQQNIIPAQEGLKYFVAGVPLPVNCFINYGGDMLPVIDFSFASDYKMQYSALQDRLHNPQKYIDVGEDVAATIVRLKKWLSMHAPGDFEISA